jgi:hypothetical protein
VNIRSEEENGAGKLCSSVSHREMISTVTGTHMARGFFESDSAVEGEAQDKAQAFRSERNGPVPLSTVAGIGAMSGILPVANEVPSNKKL